MRQIVFIIVLILLGISVFSQENEHHFDASVYFFNNNIVPQKCEGGGSIEDANGLRVGIQYNYRFGKSKWFNTGLLILRSSHITYGGIIHPDIPQTKEEQAALIFQIPVRLRFDLNKRFYLKSGFTVDIQPKNGSNWTESSQTGIGLSIAAGVDFKIQEKLHIALEPEFGYLSMIQLPLQRKVNCHDHFLLLGLNLNFGYRF